MAIDPVINSAQCVREDRLGSSNPSWTSVLSAETDMLRGGFLQVLWHLAISALCCSSMHWPPLALPVIHNLWLQHNCAAQQKQESAKRVCGICERKDRRWETNRRRRGEKKKGESKQRRQRTPCVSAWGVCMMRKSAQRSLAQWFVHPVVSPLTHG